MRSDDVQALSTGEVPQTGHSLLQELITRLLARLHGFPTPGCVRRMEEECQIPMTDTHQAVKAMT